MKLNPPVDKHSRIAQQLQISGISLQRHIMISRHDHFYQVGQLPEPGIKVDQRLHALALMTNVPGVDEYVPGGHDHFAVQAMGICHAYHE